MNLIIRHCFVLGIKFIILKIFYISIIAAIVNDPQVLNLTLIKYKLLDTWLPDKSNDISGSLEETMTQFNLMKSLQQTQNNDKSHSDENDKNYWRCVYILQGFEEAKESLGSEYLYQVTFSEDDKWTINHQLRALKCLLSVKYVH